MFPIYIYCPYLYSFSDPIFFWLIHRRFCYIRDTSPLLVLDIARFFFLFQIYFQSACLFMEIFIGQTSLLSLQSHSFIFLIVQDFEVLRTPFLPFDLYFFPLHI